MGMQDVARAGQRASRSAWIDRAARAGLVAYAAMHLVIAFLALRIAFGAGGGSASSQGALHALARQPFGHGLLLAVAIGLFLLALWRLVDGLTGHLDHDAAARWGLRVVDVGKAAVYTGIGVSGLRLAAGGSSHSHTRSWTARLMDLPAGQVLVALVGIGIAVYGGVMVWRGVTGRVAEKLDAEGRSGESGRAYLFLGAAGSVAKGVAFLVVAALFCYAAATHDAHRSGGLDVALHTVVQQPFGPWLLALVALGIGCYGLFALARARHLSR
ncbi:MAG: DUF1206 domain-containing protein [Marmoricola sp.]